MRKETQERLMQNQYDAVVNQNKQLQSELIVKNALIVTMGNAIEQYTKSLAGPRTTVLHKALQDYYRYITELRRN